MYRSWRFNQSVTAMVDLYGAALRIRALINNFDGVTIDQAMSQAIFVSELVSKSTTNNVTLIFHKQNCITAGSDPFQS